MIDEKKLIDRINSDVRLHYMKDVFVYIEIMKIIESQPKVGEWIPVEKQLPMPYMEVQLRYIGLDGKVYSDGIAVVDFNGKWHWSNGEVDDEEIHPDVEPVEWRAIPEPYEVKE